MLRDVVFPAEPDRAAQLRSYVREGSSRNELRSCLAAGFIRHIALAGTFFQA